MNIKQAQKNRVNNALGVLTRNNYFDSLPINQVQTILNNSGLHPDLDGIYCGEEGRDAVEVAGNSMLIMSWYKMESGRYEFLAYLS